METKDRKQNEVGIPAIPAAVVANDNAGDVVTGATKWRRSVTARSAARARRFVRANRERAMAALMKAARGEARAVLTIWKNGVSSTYGGKPQTPGAGQALDLSIDSYAEIVANYGREQVFAKGRGWSTSLGTSRWMGSSDAECVARTGLFLDSDEDGNWTRLAEVLEQAGIAYVAQGRTDAGKFHLELFFAEPLVPPDHGVERQRWKKACYRPVVGWLQGFFAELGRIEGDFDAATDRLLTQNFLYCRREECGSIPTTHYRPGCSLDVDILLRETGFVADDVEDRGDRDPAAADDASEDTAGTLHRAFYDADALARAFLAAGLVVGEIGEKTIVICPNRDEHSSNTDGSTATVVFRGNRFRCLHSHCSGIEAKDVYGFLSGEARAVVDAAAKPEILLSRGATEIVNQAIAAVAKHGRIYQRVGQLVHVVSDGAPRAAQRAQQVPRIVTVDLAHLEEVLEDSASWVYPKKSGEKKRARVPTYVSRAFQSRKQWPEIPYIDSVVTVPVFRPDGSVIVEPGYDVETGIMYELRGEQPQVPTTVSPHEAREAARVLLNVVRDFPFASPAHASAWLASVVTPFVRAAVDSCPIVVLDANAPGSGKGLLSDCTAMIATGRPAPRMAHVSNDDEARKQITALVLTSPAIVLIDNVEGTLGGPALNAALTADEWQDRLLGSNSIVRAQIRWMWMATGNNILLDGDTTRRTLHVRMQTPHERPEERTDFHHPDLRAFIKSKRASLVRAALTMMKGYFLAGCPDMGLRAWGSYERWARLVCHAIAWCGLEDPGATLEGLRVFADSATSILASLIAGLQQLDPDAKGCSARNILLAGQSGSNPALAAFLDEIGNPTNAEGVGRRLRQYRGRIVNGCAVGCRKLTGTTLWFVKKG